MKHERKSAEEATVEEVRQYARFLGLEIEKAEHKATVLAKIGTAGFNTEQITVFEEIAPTPTPKRTMTVKNRLGKECYKVMIPEEDKPGGEEAVPVGVNGSVMLIPRGQDVLVPVEYVGVLRNAVMDIYDPVKDGLGGIRKPRKVPAYPFQLVPFTDADFEAEQLAS